MPGRTRRPALAADKLLTGCISRLGDPQTEARYPARRRMFFATELDLHRGMMRGYRVQPQPPRARRDGGGSGEPDPELATFLPARFVR